MANRLVLGAFDGTYVLRVSRPGYNVLATGLTPEQLAFDSRWQETGNVYARGSFTADNTSTYTINYGTTFSSPPLILVRIVQSAKYNAGGNDIDGTFQNNVLIPGLSSFTYKMGSVSQFGGSQAVYYTIYRNLYG